VRQVRDRRIRVLVERIDDAVLDDQLMGRRDVLDPERVAGAADELQRRRGDAEVEAVDRLLDRLAVDVLGAEALSAHRR